MVGSMFVKTAILGLRYTILLLFPGLNVLLDMKCIVQLQMIQYVRIVFSITMNIHSSFFATYL